MSAKIKVLLLFFCLCGLIFFTVYNYDYNTILANDDVENKQRVHSFYDKYKNKALEKYNTLKLYVLQTIYGKEDSDIITLKEPVKYKNIKIDTAVNKKDDEKSMEESTKEEIVQAKDEVLEEVKEVEEKKVETVEKVKEELNDILTNDDIQDKINQELKKNKITFKRASVKLTKKSYKTIEEVSKILKKYTHINIEIGGHTDSKGRASLNRRISQKRANEVMRVLINLGIKSSRLSAKGYGEKYPIAKEDSSGLSEENRRVEMKIIKGEK